MLRTIFSFRWKPGQDTVVAAVTAVLMTPAYYLGAQVFHGVLGLVIFTVLTNGVLNVLFPAYYMLKIRGERLDELGITIRRWWMALAVSIAWSLLSWKGLQRELQSHPNIDLMPHLIFNGLILWEPFFVFGWLQLRFERAFGLIPGILLAACSFGAYHLGTYPLPGVVMLAAIGVGYGILFRLTKNLLTLWPLTWAVASSIGTLQGNMQFDWGQVATYAVLLLVQIAAIAWMCKQR